MWSCSSPDPGFVSFSRRWRSWRESGRKESLIPAISTVRSFGEFPNGKRALSLGSSKSALPMVAGFVLDSRLGGVCLARLKNRFFNDQLDLSDLWFTVTFTGFLSSSHFSFPRKRSMKCLCPEVGYLAKIFDGLVQAALFQPSPAGALTAQRNQLAVRA